MLETGLLWLHAQLRWRKEVETVGDVMKQNMRFRHTGEVTGMKVLKGTSLTNQPFFIGWYNSGWVSSRKENNKNKIAQKEIKKENGFQISYFRIPLQCEPKLLFLKTRPESPTDQTAVRAGRWERKEVCLGSSGETFVRFQNYLAQPTKFFFLEK